MTIALLVRRFLDDYARNRTNLFFLALVPFVFVVVAADSMARAARLFGGATSQGAVETVTAGWSAAFLAAIAMYFQVSAARSTDRRLVLSGLSRTRLVAARMAAGGVLAAVASAAALLALQVGRGIDGPLRVTVGTVIFALIYLALGAIVGATVRNPVNGTVLLLFVWIIDVFLGPTLGSLDSAGTRLLPTHFVSLWLVGLPTGHGGPGELAWSLAWLIVAIAVAVTVVAGTSSIARRRRFRRAPGSAMTQLRTGLKMGWHDWRRMPVLWVLLAVVPAVFVLLSDLVTRSGQTAIAIVENGVRLTAMFDPAEVHPAVMTPVAVAALGALTGIFVAIDARPADHRLALAGQRIWVVAITRLSTVVLAGLLASAVAVAITAIVFVPSNWIAYAGANLLIALTYGLIGLVLGPLAGRVSGAFLAFLIPFLDIAMGQSPMLRSEPAGWAGFLPGYGGMRILVDGALTPGFDEASSLALALGWIVALTGAAIVLSPRLARARGTAPTAHRPSRSQAA